MNKQAAVLQGRRIYKLYTVYPGFFQISQLIRSTGLTFNYDIKKNNNEVTTV
jgi:hypothetical protein